MRSTCAAVALLVFGCSQAEPDAAPTPPEPAATSTGSESGPASNERVADNPRCRVYDKPDLVAVSSDADGYVLLLPGKDWRVACNGETALYAESSRGFRVSLNFYATQSRVEMTKYLADIGNNVARGMREQGLSPSEVSAGVSGNNQTPFVQLSVEVTDSRSHHFWTARRRKDGVLLDLHTSWTGPIAEATDGASTIQSVNEKLMRDFFLMEELAKL